MPRRCGDDAVTPVVAILLLVAMSVGLAGVVWVATGGPVRSTAPLETASASLRSAIPGVVTVTLARTQSNGPVPVTQVLLQLDGQTCAIGSGGPAVLEDANGDGAWGTGETLRIGHACPSGVGPVPGGAHVVTGFVGGVPLAMESNVFVR